MEKDECVVLCSTAYSDARAGGGLVNTALSRASRVVVDLC